MSDTAGAVGRTEQAADAEDELSRRVEESREAGDVRTIRRITLNLRKSDIDRIEAIASATGLTANEILRRALATEEFVQRNRKQGRKLLVENADETLREVEFLY